MGVYYIKVFIMCGQTSFCSLMIHCDMKTIVLWLWSWKRCRYAFQQIPLIRSDVVASGIFLYISLLFPSLGNECRWHM